MTLNVDETCARLRQVLNETRGLGRRDFIKALGAAFAGATSSALLGGAKHAAAADLPVTAFVFGGVWKKAAMKAFGEPFTQKTGIAMAYQDPYTFGKLRAMHEAHAMQVDVVSVQGEEIYQAERMNMIMPLDFNVIDRSVLDPRQLRHGNAIGAHTLSYVICYNKKKWPGDDHPKSWADFWNVERYPGRRMLRTEELWTIEAALKADGVKDSEFYPLDVDRAFRSLDRIKPHVRTWYSDNSLSQQLMEQEEMDLIAMMNGRATEFDPRSPRAIRDRMERGHLRKWRARLDRAGRLSESARRHEVSRLRRPARIRGDFRAADVLRTAESQGLRSGRARHRKAFADLFGKPEGLPHRQL